MYQISYIIYYTLYNTYYIQYIYIFHSPGCRNWPPQVLKVGESQRIGQNVCQLNFQKLLMEEILHQIVDTLCHYLRGR